jgi:hypothetical protein
MVLSGAKRARPAASPKPSLGAKRVGSERDGWRMAVEPVLKEVLADYRS